MTKKVYISKSARDDELFDRIESALDNVGYNSISFDWGSSQSEYDIENLNSKMKSCDACFVFPSPDNWAQDDSLERLIAETTVAASLDLPIAIFKEEGDDYEINFLNFDILVSYDRESLPLQLQEQIKEVKETQGHEGLGLLGGGLLGLAAIGTGGAALIGALLGGAMLVGKEQKALVRCPDCEWTFGYWGQTCDFRCLHCHTEMDSHSHMVEEDK